MKGKDLYLNPRRCMMKKKIAFSSLFTLLLVLSLVILAEAGTARFPVVIKWDTSGHSQVYTDVFLLNLTGAPVNVDLDLYTKDGIKLTCGVVPIITIPANGTHHIWPSGCFAIAMGVALDFEGIGLIKAPANAISIYWRIYDETASPHELIDHGKETPAASILK
jgi:hypothetical protein